MGNATYTDIIRDIALTVGTIASILAIIVILRAWREKWIEPIRKLAVTGNAFAKKILPGVLEHFENEKLTPKGTLKIWTEVVSEELFKYKSLKALSEKGKVLSSDSKINEIIDTNLEYFYKKVEDQKPTTALDVESAAFYALVKELHGDSDKIDLIKNYLVSHPDITMTNIAYVGSFYLRNKYLKEHEDIFKQDEQNSDKKESE